VKSELATRIVSWSRSEAIFSAVKRLSSGSRRLTYTGTTGTPGAAVCSSGNWISIE
jgi:hypothetical protein